MNWKYISQAKTKKMKLDFDYTCPVIDAGIENVKEVIYLEIKDLLEEHNGKELTPNDILNTSESFRDRLYGEIEYIFEEVRELNEKMREALNEQLNDMGNKIEGLKSGYEEFERAVDYLERQIMTLESEIRVLAK